MNFNTDRSVKLRNLFLKLHKATLQEKETNFFTGQWVNPL